MARRASWLPVCVSAATALFAAWSARAETRRFELRYEARLDAQPGQPAQPGGGGEVDLWLPLVEDNGQQTVRSVRIDGGDGAEVVHDARYGNAALHLRRRTPATVTVTYVVERRDEAHDVGAAAPAGAAAATTTTTTTTTTDPALARWLVPDKLGGLIPAVKSYTGKATAGRAAPLAKARGIYDLVVATMKYDKSGTGWGKGDVTWACSAKRGNCTDFHTLFVAMARAAGIPARFEIGLPLPDQRGAGDIPGYHCWARFWIDGAGWLPVDASEAKKHPEKRERFFGGHDENRVQLSVGRDLQFPGMAGELSYFVHPYAESAGKPIAVAYRYAYKDLPADQSEHAQH
jgi:transglutaminase-like putative cysteine protease